jgi:hypothetical protein
MAEDTTKTRAPVRPPVYDPKTGLPVMPASDPAPSPSDPSTKPADAKEPTPQERLEAVLFSMRENARHGAPTAPGDLKELEAIAAAGRGGKVVRVVAHEFPGGRYHDNQSIVVHDGAEGKVRILSTAEDALDYIRSLPDEVRNRPKWVVAERSLLSALDTNEPRAFQGAYVAISEAQDEDATLNAPEREPFERLPDGRIREDRFADRRLPEPVPPAA